MSLMVDVNVYLIKFAPAVVGYLWGGRIIKDSWPLPNTHGLFHNEYRGVPIRK